MSERHVLKLSREDELDLRRDALTYALRMLPDLTSDTGIYGYEVCQACGEIGSYSGMWGAVGSHQDRVFVSSGHAACREVRLPKHRWCEICRCRIEPDALVMERSHPICPDCVAALGRQVGPHTRASLLRKFTRSRPRYHGLIETGGSNLWTREEYLTMAARSRQS
jgi:hypothetical protein